MRNAEAFAARNAKRWMRPDAARFTRPVYDAGVVRRVRAAHEASTQLLLAGLRIANLLLKSETGSGDEDTPEGSYGYHWEDQPRAPAGTPEGGQWVSEGGGGVGDLGSGSAGADTGASQLSAAATEDDGHAEQEPSDASKDALPENGNIDEWEFSDVRRKAMPPGHHFTTYQVFTKYDLKPETRAVFENSTTGRLKVPKSNYNDEMHRAYNVAVDQAFINFSERIGVAPRDMSPAHAEVFDKEIKDSKEPRIRGFLMRLYLREIMYPVLHWRRGGRGE